MLFEMNSDKKIFTNLRLLFIIVDYFSSLINYHYLVYNNSCAILINKITFRVKIEN